MQTNRYTAATASGMVPRSSGSRCQSLPVSQAFQGPVERLLPSSLVPRRSHFPGHKRRRKAAEATGGPRRRGLRSDPPPCRCRLERLCRGLFRLPGGRGLLRRRRRGRPRAVQQTPLPPYRGSAHPLAGQPPARAGRPARARRAVAAACDRTGGVRDRVVGQSGLDRRRPWR